MNVPIAWVDRLMDKQTFVRGICKNRVRPMCLPFSSHQVAAPTMQDGDKMGPGSELEGSGKNWWDKASGLMFQDTGQ